MNMMDKKTIYDKDSDKLIDELDNLEGMDMEELASLLQDKNVARDAELLMLYRQSEMRHRVPSPHVEREWERFRNMNMSSTVAPRLFSLKNIFYTVASVAAIVLVVFVWIHFDSTSENNMLAFESNNAPQKVMIGDEGEDLIPIDAQQKEKGVVLSDGKADFSKVGRLSDDGGMKTITTPRGKDFEVVLSDGTVVLLNADSKLIFPKHFVGNNRKVRLEGEAYFKVTKNKHLPFIVETDKVSTKVLGTEFNLKAYPHSPANVTLITGSVAVNSNGKEILLKPGQNAEVDSNHAFDVTTVDTECYTQWKDGYFYFDNVPLIDVVRELGRWYNINIEIRDNSLMSYRLHFIASRKASISEFVNNLNEFNYLSVVQKDNRLIIDKKEKAAH